MQRVTVNENGPILEIKIDRAPANAIDLLKRAGSLPGPSCV